MLESDRRWDVDRLARAVEGGLVVADGDGRPLLRSEGAELLLGGPRHFAAGWAAVHACVERLGRLNEGSFDVALPEALGGRRLCVHLLASDERDGYAAVLRERRSLDALQADLRRAVQMRHLQATWAQAAHDLRAPLHALALHVDLLRQDLAGEPAPGAAAAARARLDLAAREIARLSRMLQVMLAQSSPHADTPRVFGLRRLLGEVLTLVRPAAARQRVELDLDLPPGRVAVLGARDHLKQALLNLAINALEAMPRGGRLEAALEVRDGRACVRLADSGPGLPPAVLEQAFRLHFTTKRDGSGIGLFTARAAVESMGGSLDLANGSPGGAVAVLDLPLAAFDAEEPCSTS
jgi:signal transduction histidine kinase